MQTTAACPELTQYKKLASGQLLSPEKEAVLDHLEKCQACVQRVESLSEKDTLVDLIRQARTLGEGPTGETVACLVERLRKLRPSGEVAPEVPAQIRLTCSGCGKTLKVKGSLAGKKVKCPHCQAVIPVPITPELRGEELPRSPAPEVGEAVTLAPTGPVGGISSAGTQSHHEAGSPRPASNELYDFLAPAQSPDELGRLGPYRVLKVLGAGGMGVVFQAEDPHLQRIVALKAMLPSLSTSESAKHRFLREARAAAALKHDHIVTIHQVGEDRGAPYLAMEFLDGEPLDVRLEREGKLPVPEVLRIGRQMALGLAAAHKRDLIHRDIKPANVWLEAETGRVKILDFGLARASGEDGQLTQQGAIIGTPAYMAPEQSQGKRLDGRCDLFSLGCVLYRMATGQPAFRGTDIVSTLMAVATETPPSPRQLDSQLSSPLSDLIMALLAKEPADRPASAQAVAQALADMAAGCAGIQAATQSPWVDLDDATSRAGQLVKARSPDVVAPKKGDLRWQPVARSRDRATTSGDYAPTRVPRPASLIGGGIGVVLLFLVVLWAAGVLRVKTKDGTIVLQNLPPDADVTVDDKTVTLKTMDGNIFAITIVAGKRQRLQVKKDGLTLLGEDVQIDAGGQRTITLRYEPKLPSPGQAKPVSPDADRRAAEWVLSIGGKVTVRTAEQERQVAQIKDLPPDLFQVIAIETVGNKKMNDSGLVLFKPLKSLRKLNLPYAQISNAGLKNLVPLPQLTELYLQGATIDDAGTEYLGQLTKLRLLNLGDVPISNTGLARFKSLTNLKELDLYQVPIDDEGLVHFKELANLEVLMLSGSKVRGPGLEHLKSLPLKTLYISYIPIGEPAMLRIGGLTNLRGLEVNQTQVGNDALKHVKAMPSLLYLDLGGTPVSDAGLEHLKGTKLTRVNLTNTKVTPAGAEALRKALPNCAVFMKTTGDPNRPSTAQQQVPATSPADALRRADIPEAALASLGGDPKRAPAELVAVLGDGRFRHTEISFYPEFSPDGTLLAVPNGGEALLFDVNSGQLLRRFRGRFGRVVSVAFSPNGAMLAVGDEAIVRFWNPRTGALLQDLSDHARDMVNRLAFTPDNQTVLFDSVDNTVLVWDVTTGRQARVLSCKGGGHFPKHVRSIAIAPDGRLAVAGTYDGHVHGWSLDTGAETFVIVPKQEAWTWVSISADGQWLASGTNNQVKVWKIADLAKKDPVPFFEKQTLAGWLQFEKHSNKLWTAGVGEHGTDRACCWDPASGQLVSSVTLQSTEQWFYYAISPDGRTLAAVAQDGRMVHLFDTRTGKPRFPDPGHTREVDSVAFSPDGRWLASGSRDHTIRVWDLATGTPRHTLTGHTGPVRSVAFSPDGKLLASGSEDRTIRLWNPATGGRVQTLNGYCRDSSVRFSPDSKLVAAGTADGGVRMWFTRNGEEARMLPRLHEGLLRCLTFSADGQRLATGGADGKLVITDLASGNVLQSFERNSAVFTVEFGADGETVAAGYVPPEPVVRVWNLKDKDFVKLDGHRDRVDTVSLRSDGRLVVTTSLDGSVRLWEIGGNPPRQMVLGLGSVSGSLSPDGRYVATGNANGTISLFRLPGPAENVGEWMAARGSPPPGLSEEAWLERVKGLYFGRVPDAVADRLRELNPGFDGKMEYKVEGGQVVSLEFAIDSVKDISPVRALPGLRSLACGGAWPVFGQITDLTPLEGMKLTSLYLRDTYVSDLSPLKGMPLTNLVCTGTKVSDLSPLAGMPLKTLHIDTTQVVDLSPLKDMKLEILVCYNTPVIDLSPLKDMKLRYLDCNATQVTGAGLAPLQEMSSVRDLRIGGGKMTEDGLAHLKKLTDLETLAFFDNRLTEAGLRNLKGMTKLQVLVLQNTGLTDADLVHLEGFLGLRELNLARTRVTDAGLEHLTSLENLVNLNLSSTAVTGKGVAKLKAALLQFLLLQDTGLTDEDVVKLKGFFRLRVLSLGQTRVTDAGLEHLTGLTNLVELYLNDTAVTDKGVAKLKAALPQCNIIR